MDRKIIAAIHVNRATSLFVSFIWFIFALHLDDQNLEACCLLFDFYKALFFSYCVLGLFDLPVRVLALFSSVECGASKRMCKRLQPGNHSLPLLF